MIRQLLERMGSGRKRQFTQANHHGQSSAKSVVEGGLIQKKECGDTKDGRKFMNNQDFTANIPEDQTPAEVFHAINNVRGWWSENIEGSTDKLGAEWTYRYKDVHFCKIRITEFVPGKKIAHVLDNRFNFTKDKNEWKGTGIIFEISKKGDKTEVRFTHRGLVPDYECFDVCSNAWGSYINGRLRSLITIGEGVPNPKETRGAKRASQ